MSENKNVQLKKEDFTVDDTGNLVIHNTELAKLIKDEKINEVNETDAHKVTITWG